MGQQRVRWKVKGQVAAVAAVMVVCGAGGAGSVGEAGGAIQAGAAGGAGHWQLQASREDRLTQVNGSVTRLRLDYTTPAWHVGAVQAWAVVGTYGLQMPPGAPESSAVGLGPIEPAVYLRAPVAGVEVAAAAGVMQPPRWGYGLFAPLALNPVGPGMPGFGYAIHSDYVTYERLIGALRPEQDAYLLAHRLAVRPFPHRLPGLELAGAEVNVVSRNFLASPLNHLPVWPFYATQHIGLKQQWFKNREVNENLWLGIRWTAAPAGAPAATSQSGTGRIGEGPPAFSWHADLLVDDMPWDAPGAYKLGAQVGLAVPFTGERTFEAEYTRINNYVFNYSADARDYTQAGLALGHPLGPDGDSLEARLTWHRPTQSWFVKGTPWLGVERRRHGSGRIGDPGQDQIGVKAAREREFLYGPVEVSWLVKAGAAFQDGTSIQLGIGPVHNQKNQAGQNGWTWEGALTVRY